MFNSFSQRHSYHLVDPSPWPFLASASSLGLTSGAIFYFYLGETFVFNFSITILVIVVNSWFQDIILEGLIEGAHTKKVVNGFSIGMLLFITSEIMFFFGFFWSYFYFSFNPSPALGGMWPPKFLDVPDSFRIPALNTFLLVASGVTLTWSHFSITSKDKYEACIALICTVLLAFIFSSYQLLEYTSAVFCISDGVYGSIFYLTTGFHGAHVILGTTALIVCLWRLVEDQFTSNHHFGFEASAWYWHFVDVVWILLYLIFYIWGSSI